MVPTYIRHVTFIFSTFQLYHICYMFFFKKLYLKSSSVDLFPTYYTKQVAGQSFYPSPYLKIQNCYTLKMCATGTSWYKMKSDYFSCFFTWFIHIYIYKWRTNFQCNNGNNITNQIAFSQIFIDQSFKFLICLLEP